MKSSTLLFLALLPLFAVVAAEPAAPKPGEPRAELLVLPVKGHGSATVTLEENMTTGFQWMAKYDPKLCKVEIIHRGPENPGGVPVCGAPGKAIITVWRLTDRPVDLTLEYRRPWEKDVPPAKVIHYAVVSAENTTLLPPAR